MRRSFAVIAAGLICAFMASAQVSTPKMDVFLGYMHVNAYSTNSLPSFSANGGGGQFAYNINRWISGVADIGAVSSGSYGGIDINSTFMNFLFGPRISFRNHSRFTPYGQVLFGGVYSATSVPVLAVPVEPPGFFYLPDDTFFARVNQNDTAFAMTAGGGLDITLSKHIRFRPIGLDYYLTRIRHTNQNNLRYTAGVNFTFGAR